MNKIKYFTYLLSLLLFTQFSNAQQKTSVAINIIPQPNQVTVGEGSFELSADATISYDHQEDLRIAELFQQFVQDNFGLDITIGKVKDKNAKIYFTSETALASDHQEAYRLQINAKQIKITGKDAGLFYGLQSLMQLFPVNQTLAQVKIPQVDIVDEPRFGYRGLHLDVGRHMFPVHFVKKYIDLIAQYKLNRFHWHLTEDQGWRIEIKKYPKLTEIGGYRDQTLISNYRNPGHYDNIRYGGFYTQDEAREIVQYAKDRFITVIPEIELPGHAMAALAAYPHLGCGEDPGPYKTAQTWGVFDDVFCAGKEETFHFLQDVLTEVLDIFPSEHIHIGGDECPKTKWEACPLCQKRIKDEGLKDEHELQSYFVQRIEKFLNSKGRQIIGWDEILEGGLAPNATVMSWRGEEGGIAAASQGHNVIMTPNSQGLYLDHKQGPDQFREPLSIGGYSTFQKIYDYDVMPPQLAADKQKHIIGVQGNVWTEYIETPAKVEFSVLPRMLALSEISWTQPEKKNLTEFAEQRVANHLLKHETQGNVYRVPEVYGLKDTIIYATSYTFKELKPSVEGAKIHYTIDDYEPSELDLTYENEVTVHVPQGENRVFKAVVITPHGRKSNYVKAVISNTKR